MENRQVTRSEPLMRGAAAGLVATLPMTAAMEVMFRALPRHEKQPLPPRQITDELASKAGVKEELDAGSPLLVTLMNHFAYGAATGGLYGSLQRRVSGNPLIKGSGFGLAVWAVSYLGWLPAMGILPPATKTPKERNALMIAAHIVFGATLGWLVGRTESRRNPELRSFAGDQESGR